MVQDQAENVAEDENDFADNAVTYNKTQTSVNTYLAIIGDEVCTKFTNIHTNMAQRNGRHKYLL